MADNSVRDAEICALYTQGFTASEIGAHFGLDRQRVQQILKQFGYDRTDRPIEKSNRNEFLGVNVSEEVKEALKVEAEKRGVSMSALSAAHLSDMLRACGYPVDAAKVDADAEMNDLKQAG